LQESRGAARQIRQKPIPQNGQSFTPVNGLGILHGRLFNVLYNQTLSDIETFTREGISRKLARRWRATKIEDKRPGFHEQWEVS
jgi:hypothetical protein